jgi:CRISPR-associated protein Cmr3
MNTLLLQPTDVLFFRDGRPMGGSLSGHGAAWPLPTVTNAALHAALWHAGEIFKAAHTHRRGKNGHYDAAHRDRKFGGLVTAGPFPVKDGTWLFPRPLDSGIRILADQTEAECHEATFLPLRQSPKDGPVIEWQTTSSLPSPLRYAVANRYGPTKKSPSSWWNAAAWEYYLGTAEKDAQPVGHNDADFADAEFSYGIGIDAQRGTQDGERFYSAHYLRLRENCRLGILAEAKDKDFRDDKNNDDLLATLFPNSGTETPVIVGGQQRLCTVRREHFTLLPLPKGRNHGFTQLPMDGKAVWSVKWALITPAIFPQINDHPGGWLPSWVDPQGQVQLLDGPGKNYAARHKVPAGSRISARLVAALVGKPVPVTGYALPHDASERKEGGAKPTLLAAPAGSVYYFECDSEAAARKLATALNWHGSANGAAIENRRSTLLGEKGFGLGVCGTWQFHPTTDLRGHPPA